MQIKLILLGLLVAGSVILTWRYFHTIEENKRLTREINAANSTIVKLDNKADAEKVITNNEETIIKGIRNAEKSENGIIVNSTIDDIERLRRARSD